MSLDTEPMRTLCPVCQCWVDSYGDGDGAIKLAGAKYHAKCISGDELRELGSVEALTVLADRG